MNAIFKLDGLVLETERLILRPFKQSDLDDFHEYASVEGVGEMAGWKHHETKEHTQLILDKFISNDKTFAIVLKENNKVIGSLGIEEYGMEEKLSEFFNYNGREIGYVLSKDYWGKGIMPEAVKTVIDYLFNVKNLDFLTCGYYDFNIQSKRVQEKCGFKPYRKLVIETKIGTKEQSILNLLINPKKKIEFIFSHPETLIWKEIIKYESRKLDDDTVKSLIELSKQWQEEDCSYGMIVNNKDNLRKPLYVAVENDKIIGYIFGHYYKLENKTSYIEVGSNCFMIDEIYVIPSYRSKGVGKELFKLMENEIKESCDYITLSTSTKDYKKILHFYVDELDMNFHSAFLIKDL